MRTVAQAARVTALGPESDGTIEVVRRADATHSYLFVINHGHAEIEIAASGHELVTDAAVDRIVRVPAGAVRVIREDTAA
ncbi:Beta-galactosidase C-terminal domain [Cryobacterium sp. 10C3]|nr:Beta-galactosidase C-terminal domain [Cryobacterium sp. 10C3]MDY7555590.1 Beta-galactosidase C-terminal domain [Cryobacterium sp. 10C3]